MPACSVEMATLDPTHPVPMMPMRMPADTSRVYRASRLGTRDSRLESRELLVRQRDVRRRNVFFEMATRGNTGNREHDPSASQQPGQGDLRGACTVMPRDPRDCGLSFHHVSCRPCAAPEDRAAGTYAFERIPGNERDAFTLAIVDDLLPLAVHQVVSILHRRDGEEASRALFVRTLTSDKPICLIFPSRCACCRKPN